MGSRLQAPDDIEGSNFFLASRRKLGYCLDNMASSAIISPLPLLPIYCSTAPLFHCLAQRGGGGDLGHSGTKRDIFRRKSGKIGPVLRHAKG